MKDRDFLKNVSNSKEDILQVFLDIISSLNIDYCVIGGLAVNAFTEPVVSLDLNLVVALEDIDRICDEAADRFNVKEFEHSINLGTPDSNLRIQIQTDPEYRDFIGRATERAVLGYRMKVAAVEDVLTGKVRAYLDKSRGRSKRIKDLADISRLIESYPKLIDKVPSEIRKEL